MGSYHHKYEIRGTVAIGLELPDKLESEPMQKKGLLEKSLKFLRIIVIGLQKESRSFLTRESLTFAKNSPLFSGPW